MPIKDIESLLQPVSPEAPSGANLEYDEAFLNLERIAQGRPEQQMGKEVLKAEEPDWKQVSTRAIDLFAKTKDLRIAVRLAHALLHSEGLAGFTDGLKVIRGLVERFWDTFYPQLDPDDDKDPTFRVNIMMGLCDGSTIVDHIRQLPLVSARTFGRFSLRDFAMATGEQPPPADTEPPKIAAIEGAFSECPVPELVAVSESLRASLASLRAVEAFVGDQVGVANGPNFSKLTGVLAAAEKFMAPRLLRRGVGVEAPAPSPQGSAAPTDAGNGGGGAAQIQPMSGDIRNRDDVIRMLDKLCEYYERNEPSSPVPMLLRRSRGLVSASFLDIVKDLAPGGVAEVEHLRGKEPG